MEKKSLLELYSALNNEETPKQKFLREVAEVTGRKPQTVKQWLSGLQLPTEETIQKIAAHFKVDPKGLFPQLEHKRELDYGK